MAILKVRGWPRLPKGAPLSSHFRCTSEWLAPWRLREGRAETPIRVWLSSSPQTFCAEPCVHPSSGMRGSRRRRRETSESASAAK